MALDVAVAGGVALTAGVLAGAVVNRVTGLGYSLVCSPAMVLVLGPRDGVRLLNMVSVVVALSNVVPSRRSIRGRDLAVLAVPAMAATPLIALAARRVDERVLSVVAGVVTVASAVVLLRGVQWSALRGRAGAVGAGLVSAATNVTAGLSGPPVAMYGVNAGWPPEGFRATLQAYFLGLNLAAVAALGPVEPSPGLAAALVAAALGGLVAGGVVARRVDPVRFRMAVLTVVVAGGMAAVIRGLT